MANYLLKKITNRKDQRGNFKTLSSASVHRIHEILSSIFNHSLRWDMIPYNPSTKVTAPKFRRARITCYDANTSKRLITTLLHEVPIKYKCLVVLAALTRFRRREIVGLHWDDIDFENRKITVKRNVYYIAGQEITEKSPKSETSIRTIYVPDICFKLLKQWRAEQGKMKLALGNKWGSSKNIFTTNNGKIMSLLLDLNGSLNF